MKIGSKTALGIDISESRLSMALVRREDEHLELVRTASCSIPEGVIKNGWVEDAAKLAKIIRELKTHNRMRANLAGTSLVVKPAVMQVMDMPRQVPKNIREYIHDEVKHCVSLAGKSITLDYCGISLGKHKNIRVFTVAEDEQKVTELAKVFHQGRINIEAIEPSVLGYVRVCYDKRIAPKFQSNVLIAVARENVLTLCVFRKGGLDFVRTKDIDEKEAGPDELCQFLCEEINAVIKFYDVEVGDSSDKWEITIIADGVEFSKDTEETLKGKVSSYELEVVNGKELCQDAGFDGSGVGDNASVVAIGLAMKLLSKDENVPKVSLLPPEASEVRLVQKDVLIAVNIVAVIGLFMILAMGGFSFTIKKVRANIEYIKETQLKGDINALYKEQAILNRQTTAMSHRPETMSRILSLHYDIDWSGLLNDIKRGAPKTLRISRMVSKSKGEMTLEGLSLSYEAIHLFVEMLNRSEYVDSASLAETEKDDEDTRLIKYTVNCTLAVREEKEKQ